MHNLTFTKIALFSNDSQLSFTSNNPEHHHFATSPQYKIRPAWREKIGEKLTDV